MGKRTKHFSIDDWDKYKYGKPTPSYQQKHSAEEDETYNLWDFPFGEPSEKYQEINHVERDEWNTCSTLFNVSYGEPSEKYQELNCILNGEVDVTSDLYQIPYGEPSDTYQQKNIKEVASKVSQLFSKDELLSILQELGRGLSPADSGEPDDKKSQSQLIVQLTKDMLFFHTPEDEAYVRLRVNGHLENWKVRSSWFKSLLSKYYYDRYQKVPGGTAMTDALNVLEGMALHAGEERRVYIRTADTGSALYLDLCNKDWQVVQITSSGWKVINDPPVMFRRTKTMGALPLPLPGGTIEALLPFLNCNGYRDFMLIVAWLLSAFRSDQPFPILTIQGEQGSAKSTSTKIIRGLIDPSIQPLSTFPDNERDLAIKANGTWVLAVDNLSGISGKISDALCKLSTGGGFSTRKLHTDDEEIVFNAMRPVILNGIDDIAKRPDLLDRAIIINLPVLPNERRRPEKDMWREFEAAKPFILGGLLDGVSGAIKELPYTTIKGDLPRMIDFALWSTAAWKANGWDSLYADFMNMYRENRSIAIQQGIESEPFLMALIQFMEGKDRWLGTATDMLNELHRFVNHQVTKNREWPTPNKVRDRIRRIAPVLRTYGIEFVELNRDNKGSRIAFERNTAKKSVGVV